MKQSTFYNEEDFDRNSFDLEESQPENLRFCTAK